MKRECELANHQANAVCKQNYQLSSISIEQTVSVHKFMLIPIQIIGGVAKKPNNDK